MLSGNSVNAGMMIMWIPNPIELTWIHCSSSLNLEQNAGLMKHLSFPCPYLNSSPKVQPSHREMSTLRWTNKPKCIERPNIFPTETGNNVQEELILRSPSGMASVYELERGFHQPMGYWTFWEMWNIVWLAWGCLGTVSLCIKNS